MALTPAAVFFYFSHHFVLIFFLVRSHSQNKINNRFINEFLRRGPDWSHLYVASDVDQYASVCKLVVASRLKLGYFCNGNIMAPIIFANYAN